VPICRVRPAEGRAGRADDAKSAAISGGDRRGVRAGLRVVTSIPTIHAARTRGISSRISGAEAIIVLEHFAPTVHSSGERFRQARDHRQHGVACLLKGMIVNFMGAK